MEVNFIWNPYLDQCVLSDNGHKNLSVCIFKWLYRNLIVLHGLEQFGKVKKAPRKKPYAFFLFRNSFIITSLFNIVDRYASREVTEN